LRQSDSRSASRDGMDIAICSISKDKKSMRFGGAGRPLYLVRDGVLTEYKGSKISIGGYYAGVKKNFFELEIAIQPGDVIFLSSDGYADQFDHENERKYSSKRLRELLASIAHMESGQQYAMIHQSFEEWKGDTRQIDDVTLVGFKI
jgi:serine phosphatase RsbU (regulator of sigma subunit)